MKIDIGGTMPVQPPVQQPSEPSRGGGGRGAPGTQVPSVVRDVTYRVSATSSGRTIHLLWKPPLQPGIPPFWTYEVIYYGTVPRGKSGGVSSGYYAAAPSTDIAISDPNVNHVEVIIMAISTSGKGSPCVAEIDLPVGPQPWSGQHPASGFRIVG